MHQRSEIVADQSRSVGRHIARIAAVAAGVTLVAACGSSSGTKGANTGNPANGGTARADSASAVPAAVQAAYQKDLTSPTKIGVTGAVPSTPPQGKTFVWMQCDQVQCSYTTKGVQQATAALHWNLKVIDYSFGNPATLVSGMQQALLYHPVAVGLDGLPPAVWQSVIPAYQAAGVAIIPGFLGPLQLSNAVVANLWNPDDLAIDDQMLADWLTVDSNGQGKVLFLGEPFFPGFASESDAFKAAVAKDCPACSVEVVDASLAQSANPSSMNGVVVSAIQKDPSIKYAVVIDGVQNVGLPAALQGAGISGVKIASALAGLDNTTDVANGSEAAATGADFTYYGWLTVDTAVRHLEGVAIAPGDGGMPHQLLVKSNVGTPFTNLNKPANYPQQFEALWKL